MHMEDHQLYLGSWSVDSVLIKYIKLTTFWNTGQQLNDTGPVLKLIEISSKPFAALLWLLLLLLLLLHADMMMMMMMCLMTGVIFAVMSRRRCRLINVCHSLLSEISINFNTRPVYHSAVVFRILSTLISTEDNCSGTLRIDSRVQPAHESRSSRFQSAAAPGTAVTWLLVSNRKQHSERNYVLLL